VLKNKEHQDLAIKYGIMGTPTIIFFCDGRPIETVTGFQPKERLIKLVEDVIATHKDCIKQSTKL
jgi:thioredoxin-like negative regulator of GroEL